MTSALAFNGSNAPFSIAAVPPDTCWQSAGSGQTRLYVVLRGRCVLESENKAVTVSESYAAVIPQNTVLECRLGGAGATIAMLSLGLLPLGSRASIYRLEDSHSYYLISRLLVGHIGGRISGRSGGGSGPLAAHIRQVVCALPAEPGDRVSGVVNAIHEQPLISIPLEALADAFDVHPMTLTREFRQARGCSIGEFRQRVRAERAFYRVIKAPQPLSDLSLVCGFSDQSHMTRQFRRFFGMTPSRLRCATRAAPVLHDPQSIPI